MTEVDEPILLQIADAWARGFNPYPDMLGPIKRPTKVKRTHIYPMLIVWWRYIDTGSQMQSRVESQRSMERETE
jgi:hypothetical protein